MRNSGFRVNDLRFPDGKRKALTLSYDDGFEYDRQLVALMNQYGIRGTFNLNSGLMGQPYTSNTPDGVLTDMRLPLEEVSELYAGHEIATHTAQHTALAGTGGLGAYEIALDRQVFEGVLPYLVQGHAYPYGMFDDDVITMLRSAGIRYARTVMSTGNFDIPNDFMRCNPTCHHDDPNLMELTKLFCEEDDLFGRPRLLYVWGHSYELGRQNNWAHMESFLSYVSRYQDQIWMATNIEIANYVQAYRSLIFSADGSKVYNPTAIDVWASILGHECYLPAGKVVSTK